VKILYSSTRPGVPVVEIVSPGNGALFPTPASFVFSAELLATPETDTGPIEFFIGTNSVGLVDNDPNFTATMPLSAVTISNLVEGDYPLTVRFRGINGFYCPCDRETNTVRVVKLGVQQPCLRPDGRFQFEVVTSFPGKQTTIESSPNLLDWFPIRTNQPSSTAFLFIEESPATNVHRFFRAFIAPELVK